MTINNRKISVIIQARMGSTRLPGKILKTIQGVPMMQYVINRVELSELIDEVIIATTTNEKDNVIADFCKYNNIKYFRGSEHDVLSRYYETAKAFNCDIVIRCTTDCPLLDCYVIENVVKKFLEGNYDYAQNALFSYGYPSGFDCSMCDFKTLEEYHLFETDMKRREHAIGSIVCHPDKYNILYFSDLYEDYSHYHLSVDTQDDLYIITDIIEQFNNNEFKFNEILEYIEKKDYHKNWKEDKTCKYKKINNINIKNKKI